MGWQCSAGTSSEARVRRAASWAVTCSPGTLGHRRSARCLVFPCGTPGNYNSQVPTLHACSDRNPWRVPARLGPGVRDRAAVLWPP